MNTNPYRWVQSVIIMVRQPGSANTEIQTLLGTTDSADETNGLDDLLWRAMQQATKDGGEIVATAVVAMNADGQMKTIKTMSPVNF